MTFSPRHPGGRRASAGSLVAEDAPGHGPDDWVRARGLEEAEVAGRRPTPLWFDWLLVVCGASVLGFGGAGLALAFVGHDRPALALPLGAAGTVVGILLGRPTRAVTAPAPISPALGTPRVAERWAAWQDNLPTVVVCVVVVGVVAWNWAYVGTHVQVDSDPGVYLLTGQWLASHGGLIVQASTPWNHTGLLLGYTSTGMYQMPGGTLEFQFAHLLGALLAEAHWLGGTGLMLRAPALLGGAGLLAIYAVGRRVARNPWLVVAAVTALAVCLPELSVSRDTFSEPLSQLLLWFGIWCLLRAYREGGIGISLLAGLAIGGTLMAHIDAVAYLVPLPILGMLAWFAARPGGERRAIVHVIAATAVGVVPGAVLGTLDVQRRTGTYYHDLHHQITMLYAALGLATAVAALAVAAGPALFRALPALVATSTRRRVGTVSGWVVGLALLAGWTLRPALWHTTSKTSPSYVQYFISTLQRAEGVPAQPTRTYAEQTLVWISWYIGPVTLGLAIIGLSLAVRRLLISRRVAACVVLLMTAPLTAIYLWQPSVSPYQIWAMRRFVPASLPLLMLMAVIALEALPRLQWPGVPARAIRRGVLGAGTVALLAFPVAATIPVARFQPQATFLPAVERVCTTVGPDAALLAPPDDPYYARFAQTLRDWCGVPVAELQHPITASQAARAAGVLRAEGRELWVIGASAKEIQTAVPGTTPGRAASATSRREVADTLTRPPSNYGSQSIQVYAAQVGTPPP